MTKLYFPIILILTDLIASLQAKMSLNDDLLSPYSFVHGSKHSIRTIRSVQPTKFKNLTYEIWESHSSPSLYPVCSTRYFSSDISEYTWNTNHAYGHFTTINNPLKTFSVYEASTMGCQKNTTTTVEQAAKMKNCFVAQNGGFFRTKTGACIGNVISDGRLCHSAQGIQNVNFGITKKGTLLTGYFSSEEVERLNFSQLIAGVIWLVRNGSSFVDESLQLEEESSEETGTLRRFADVTSARTAIGHDRDGRVVFVQVDGQTNQEGTNLKAFAKFLIEQLHVVNAINLDGGGSATLVLNGSLANYPSDHCVDDPMWRCQRSISTIICAHEPFCDPPCENGDCVMGKCNCYANWDGEICDVLNCSKTNCSEHGTCSASGCLCSPGWMGDDCQLDCKPGWFGLNCSQKCLCAHDSVCDPISGHCTCGVGFTGKICDQKCSAGSYGVNCQYDCQCNESCVCDAMTGTCLGLNETSYDQPLYNVSQCLANNFQRKLSTATDNYLSRLQIVYVAYAGLILSFLLNVLLVGRIYYKSCNSSTSYSGNDIAPSNDQTSDPTIAAKSSKRTSLVPFRWSNKVQYTRLNSNPETLEMENLIS